MSEQFDARLAECLDAVDNPEAGESVAEILARYPDDAAALRHTLAVAGRLPAFGPEPSQAAASRARNAFLSKAASMRRDAAARPKRTVFVAARVSIIVALITAAGAIPVAASENALPGDALYSIKRGVEDVQLQFAPDEAARQGLIALYNSRRFQELDDLLDVGRPGETEFKGTLDSLHLPRRLVVSGRSIAVPKGMNVPDIPLGTLVEVTVRVEGSTLMLVEIEPVGPDDAPILTATLSPIPTTVPTATPRIQLTPEDVQGDDEGQQGEQGEQIESTEAGPEGQPGGEEGGTSDGGDGQNDGGGDSGGGHSGDD